MIGTDGVPLNSAPIYRDINRMGRAEIMLLAPGHI
jgi:hypothetical protein